MAELSDEDKRKILEPGYQQAKTPPSVRGLGGWLIVIVGFPLVYSLLRGLALPLIMLTVTSTYNLKILISALFFGIVCSPWLLFLYFRHKAAFPKQYTFWLFASYLYDYYFIFTPIINSTDRAQVIGGLIFNLLAILYMKYSKRVSATFIEPL